MLLALPAAAFDSDAWLAKRAALDADAERMRAAYTNTLAQVDSPAEDITIPIESYPNGTVKASISAKRAQFFLAQDLVWGEGVVAREYAEDGVRVTAQVEANHCVIDRKTRCGWAEGPAKISVSGTTVEGEGIYFSFSEEFVKILSKVVIKSTDLKFEGVKL